MDEMISSLSALYVYPIKSCGGIPLREAVIGAEGLAHDRNWMLVDRSGRFLSQRDHPCMAAITVALKKDALIAVAPGMPPLRIPLQYDAAAAVIHVSIWNDAVAALDCGDEMHRWFSSCMGTDARLVRFDPAVCRVCSPHWTAGISAATRFADGFPLLVIGEASLRDLNRRLQDKGAPVLPMERFRPNLVLSGLDAYEEDYIDTVTIGEQGSEVILKLIKPCARCPVPGVDQRTGLRDPQWPGEPLDTLAAYRANTRVGGGLTFGQNAIVTQGAGRLLQLGQEARCELAF